MINDSGDLSRETQGVETGIDSQKNQIPEFTTWHENGEAEGSRGVNLKSRPVGFAD